MSNKRKYANWCNICKKPLLKNDKHTHCPKCNISLDMVSKYEDACARWGIEGIYHYTCAACKYTWITNDQTPEIK